VFIFVVRMSIKDSDAIKTIGEKESEVDVTPELSDARVRELGLYRLTRSELSELALSQYLQRKGATEQQAAREVARLVALGMVCDRRVARALIRSQLLRGKSGYVVRQYLRLKGVQLSDSDWKDYYGGALNEVSGAGFSPAPEVQDPAALREAERCRAQALLERKYARHGQDPKVARRAFAELLRRGFSLDIVRSLVSMRRQ
jgi:SOS response regulatory protein OraA/RecX